jgi:DNA excision repair protein ERCC-5
MKESRKLKESAVRNSPRLQSASEELPSSDSPSHVLAHADAVELGSPAVYVELSAISPSRASQASSYNGVVNKMYTDKEIDEAMNLTENNDRAWTEERNRRERDMDSVTDEMKLEVMQLLRLFGVPFFEAPAEAESQCVELERLGLVHGVITEDSDALVFGGKTIYKNIFEDQKYAEVYKAVDAEREMGLGRSQMVALAMLLGGDYTEGVKGVGIVNAMEILDAFDFSTSAIEGLRMFKEWMDGIDLSDTIDLNQMRGMKAGIHDFHTKHKSARSRWVAPDGFPSESILKAYEQPVVDTSRDRFTWGTPDAVGLIMFCHQNMGWSTEETKALLDPVLNQMNGLRQTRLDAFIPMRYEDSIKFANVKSKRLRNVLQKKKTCSRVNEEE